MGLAGAGFDRRCFSVQDGRDQVVHSVGSLVLGAAPGGWFPLARLS